MSTSDPYRRTQTRPDLPDPYNDRTLPDYLNSVERWFGHIRFLGLPDRNETPDYPIERLFVHPYAHTRHVRMDEDPATWQSGLLGILPLVEKHRRLVMLGDPGAGKSTLLAYIAWQFTTRSGEWLDKLGPLVPIPIIIRDLAIGPDITWDRLCEKFLEHKVAQGLLNRPQLDALIERGQAYFLVDGLDELTNRTAREKLQVAVFSGFFGAASKCRWLLTSRVVGYDELPYDWVPQTPEARARLGVLEKYFRFEPDDVALTFGPFEVKLPGVHRYYVAPLDDRQIELFALNWFRARDSRPDMEDHVRRFLRNLRTEKGPADLARNPTLLTLTAMIYLTYNVLPHGRAKLYGKVAEAYLESIDRARGFDAPFTRERMEHWLGYIAFQMQLQRAAEEKESGVGRQSTPTEILVNRDTILRWLTKDLKRIGGAPSPAQAEEFLQYAGRRTGLFLPRGEGVYAFTHLSFQEYFAAVFLAATIDSVDEDDPIEGATLAEVGQYAATAVWRETLILLFEVQFDPRKTRKLRKVVFGGRFEMPPKRAEDDLGRAILLAEVLIDPFNGLEVEDREVGSDRLMEWEWHRQQDSDDWNERGPFAALLSGSGHEPTNRHSQFEQRWDAKGPKTKRLALSGCTGLTSPPDLDHAQRLIQLDLSGCTGLTSPPDLDHAAALKFLNLTGCTGLTSPPDLDHAATLEFLNLTGCTGLTSPPDLDHAAALKFLNLTGCTGLTSPPDLDHAAALEFLFLSGCTGLTSPPDLDHAKSLRTLIMSGCTGLTSPPDLNHAKSLTHLFLSGCAGLTSPPDLDHAAALEFLFLSGCTGLTKPPSLEGAEKLATLNLRSCTGIKRLPANYGRPGLEVLFP